MSALPVSPSPFDKVIRAVAAVRTKSGIAAFTVLLLFLCFFFSLFLATGMLQWVLTILSLFFLVGFATFSVITTKQGGNNKKISKL